MTEINERLLAQLDAVTAREARQDEEARWGGPDVYVCSRGHWSEVPERCPTCGEHRPC